MTWFRLECLMPQHEKWAPLSDGAFRLAITAGCWCAARYSDGILPKKVIPSLTRAPSGKKLSHLVNELIAARIWDTIEGDEENLSVHGFLDWNISRDAWEKKKAAGSEGGKAKAAGNHDKTQGELPSKSLAGASDLPEQASSIFLAGADLVLQESAAESCSKRLADSDPDSKRSETKKENSLFLDSGARDLGSDSPTEQDQSAVASQSVTQDALSPQPATTPAKASQNDATSEPRKTGEVKQATTRPRDPFREQLTGKLPGDNPDVIRVYETWKQVFGFNGSRLAQKNGPIALCILDAVKVYGVEECEKVIREAPNDGMVSGKTDREGVAHNGLPYILGNETAFARIQKAANEKLAPKEKPLTMIEKINAIKQKGRIGL